MKNITKRWLRIFVITALFITAALAPSCKDDGPNLFTVKFNSNGGTMFPWQFIEAGGKVDKPAPDPVRASFRFDGWFTDNTTFSNEWNFTNDVVIADMTLFAGWTEVPPTFTVSFNSNGGSEVAPQTVVQGGKVEKPANPTKSGSLFEGWFRDNNTFNNEWDFDVNTVIADVVLFAKWNISNVAFNKPVIYDSFLDGYPGEYAVDGITYVPGSLVSRWISDDSNSEHWLEIDLQGFHVISAVTVWRQNPGGNQLMPDFSFQAWINGVWKSVVSWENYPMINTGIPAEAEFEPVTTDKVRLYVPPYTDNRARVWEIEVWGYLLDE